MSCWSIHPWHPPPTSHTPQFALDHDAITSAESLHAIHTQAMSQSQGERLQFREIELADFMLHWKALFALSRVAKCSVFHVVSLSFGFYLSFYRDLFTFVGFFRVLSTLKFSNFCMIFFSLFIDFLLSFLELKLKVRNRNYLQLSMKARIINAAWCILWKTNLKK